MGKNTVALSSEQEEMIRYAMMGKNVLVDACIGSGKTTTIQQLCDRIPRSKRILYLTYNKLLKLDAKAKITRANSVVQNYHGFAYMCLSRMNVKSGIADLIQKFNELRPNVSGFDVLIIDEYQDIEKEHAEMLEYIKESNPDLQIIMVGDMRQKIYDKTTLDVEGFVAKFLGEHITMAFTKCFRISEKHAAMLGRVWGKSIEGVNADCQIITMDESEIVPFLAEQDPEDFLCLGQVSGSNSMQTVLNVLEKRYPKKFNKYTVYASIQDTDRTVAPPNTAAIFTSYDSSKGLERDICVVFDFTLDYWLVRLNKKGAKYDIIRNIFCVAASRGKKQIIFVNNGHQRLTEGDLKNTEKMDVAFPDVNISEMFDFKYEEDIEECFSFLETKPMRKKDKSEIDVRTNDGLIDLSPCIGMYQEACFFTNFSMRNQYELYERTHRDRADANFKAVAKKSLDTQILTLVSKETGQDRYATQAANPFVSEEEKSRIISRLSLVFCRSDDSQVHCELAICDSKGEREITVDDKGSTGGGFYCLGFADVVKNKTVYELKFVNELQHTHFLQLAMYMIALDLDKGILWNVRFNEMYSIKILDKQKFLDAVARTVTKHEYSGYAKPLETKPAENTFNLKPKERQKI